jgi:hypothetical protein
MSSASIARRAPLEDRGTCQLLLGQFFGGADIGCAGGNVEEQETDMDYMGAVRQSFGDAANCDFRGLVNRIPKGSSGYRRERH